MQTKCFWVDTLYRSFYVNRETEEIHATIKTVHHHDDGGINLEVYSWGEGDECVQYLNLDTLKAIVEETL